MITVTPCDLVQRDKTTRKGEIPATANPPHPPVAGVERTNPQNTKKWEHLAQEETRQWPNPPCPKCLPQPWGHGSVGTPPMAAPCPSRPLPLPSIPRAGGWEQLAESWELMAAWRAVSG